MSRVSVKKSEPPETKEILASAITKISEAADELSKSGLNKKAIVTLLHDYSKVNKREIIAVLDGLKQLRGWYCR